MIAVGELYYVTLSFDSITQDQAQSIIDFAIQETGSRVGMSVSYGEPI